MVKKHINDPAPKTQRNQKIFNFVKPIKKGGKGLSLRATARIFHISSSRVHQIIQRDSVKT